MNHGGTLKWQNGNNDRPAVARAATAANEDHTLLDAYSRTVSRIARQASAAVAHIQAANRSRQGSGSGFAFTPDGFVLTNSHVVHGGGTLMATFADGHEHRVRLEAEGIANGHGNLARPEATGVAQRQRLRRAVIEAQDCGIRRGVVTDAPRTRAGCGRAR